MKTLCIYRFTTALGMAATLTACAAPPIDQTPTPASQWVLRGPLYHVSRPQHPDRGRSWMVPGAKSIKRLLYVSDGSTNDVYVYNYKTGTLVGKLTGFDGPEGQCVDKNGDVWIVNDGSTNTVVEYARGGSSPLKTLDTVTYSNGCAIDPTTGNLAVTGLYGQLLLFKNASGSATTYQNNQCLYLFPPGYDSNGNLYVQAVNSGTTLCELPHGGTSFKYVQFLWINFPGSIMWDGKHLTLTDTRAQQFENQTAIYEVTESALGKLSGTRRDSPGRRLRRRYSYVPQPFIVGTKNTPVNQSRSRVIVGANIYCSNRVDFGTSYGDIQPKRSPRTCPAVRRIGKHRAVAPPPTRKAEAREPGAPNNLAADPVHVPGGNAMRISGSSRYALASCVAASLLAGCGGSQRVPAYAHAVTTTTFENADEFGAILTTSDSFETVYEAV